MGNPERLGPPLLALLYWCKATQSGCIKSSSTSSAQYAHQGYWLIIYRSTSAL
ncbi:hypothetical protein ACFFUP_17480 [Vibrio ostreicida]|uniref:Uncharacterized protein n=1 Tax=Vibrio ostreicida TaxID=526588 RepID=A0ABT8BZ16_9VIBR|nr:hypothetical protein [Vibrio ostreicida]MDN3611654.1 hypothetical protein [Vibrio ostreicida]NPD10146.1 hypothetical protein [Vibrio ostreicida]